VVAGKVAKFTLVKESRDCLPKLRFYISVFKITVESITKVLEKATDMHNWILHMEVARKPEGGFRGMVTVYVKKEAEELLAQMAEKIERKRAFLGQTEGRVKVVAGAAVGNA